MSSRKIIYALLTCLTLTACSEVELCDSVHPHVTPIKFKYEWGDNEAKKPDNMGVLMYRVVNKWSQLVGIDTNTGLVSVVEPPTTEEEPPATEEASTKTRADDEGTPGETPDDTPEVTTTDKASVPPGEYKFITFPLDSKEFDYSDVFKFIETKGLDFTLHDIGLDYKEYSINDPNLHKGLQGWDDYNAYSKYIQPDVDIMFYDSTQMVTVERNVQFEHVFRPQALSQNVDIYFDIEKKIDERPFVIDSVWAEISGIPRHLNLRNGYLDIKKTNKMMFKSELTPQTGEKGKDNDNNPYLKCHGNIDVTSIVNVQQKPGQSESDVMRKIYGPGIMQVIIYSHTTDPETGKLYRRKWQGIINLFRVLNKANLTEVSQDGGYVKRKGEHGVLQIDAKLVIDGEKIVASDGDNEPIDRWIPTSNILIDI